MLRGAPDRHRGSRTRASPSVRLELLRFVALGLAAVLILSGVTLVLAQRLAEHWALEDARVQAGNLASRLVAPLVDARVRAAAPGALEDLDLVMDNRMRDGSLAHAKVWDEGGRVLWSDDPAMIGRTYDLSPEVRQLFGTHGSTARISALDRAENAGQRGEGELVEVYAGELDRDGRPVVFEAYLTTERLQDDSEALVALLVPLVVGAMLLLLLVLLPIAVSLTRRVEHAEQERGRLARHALRASERERRRIAGDLHDGVVQDLAGLGYALPTAARELRAGGDPDQAIAVVERATELLRDDVARLRSLMVDIYPPDLRGGGLRDALHHLVRTEAHEAGLRAEVLVPATLTLPPDVGRLAYRVVREGVRNVVKHAEATRVRVVVREEGAEVCVSVTDDGRGIDDEAAAPAGHLGLRALYDTLEDFGGSLRLGRADDTGGTVLVARYPAAILEH